MRVSNAEQFQADAISVEPDLFHSTGNPGSDFAEDEFNHKPLGSLFADHAGQCPDVAEGGRGGRGRGLAADQLRGADATEK